MGFKLYELSESYNNLFELLEDDSVPIEVVQEALANIEDLVEVKMENIAKLVKHTESLAKVLDEESKKLKSRATTMNNKAKSMKSYMLDNLTVMNKKSIETPLFKIRRQKNPPSVLILDPSKVHEKYRIPQEDKIDSKELLKDLKAGNVVDGAQIAPESYHIRF